MSVLKKVVELFGFLLKLNVKTHLGIELEVRERKSNRIIKFSLVVACATSGKKFKTQFRVQIGCMQQRRSIQSNTWTFESFTSNSEAFFSSDCMKPIIYYFKNIFFSISLTITSCVCILAALDCLSTICITTLFDLCPSLVSQ